ncbi:MAG: spore germination protein [Alicyclobacillus sp.]|nr:spore germination protein [Alicyclobacillus sp.]
MTKDHPSADKEQAVAGLQYAMGIGTTLIGVGILAFPRLAVETAGTAAPLATAVAVGLMVAAGSLLAHVLSQSPQDNLFESSTRLLGRLFGGLLTLALTLYFLELTALAAREFGEVVVTSVLQRTPVEVTILVMILLAALAARNNVIVFARILTFYMPFVYFPALVIVLLTLKNAEIVHMQPLFNVFSTVSWYGFVQAVKTVAALFPNFMVAGLVIPHLYRPQRAVRWTALGIAMAGSLYLIVMLATLSVFGTGEMRRLLWVTLELAKTAAAPLLFLERTDPVFLAVWVTAVFTGVLTSYMLAVKGLSHLCGFSNHRVWTVLAVPPVYVMAMQPVNITDLYGMIQWVSGAGLVLTLGCTLVLWTAHWLRHRPHNGRVVT